MKIKAILFDLDNTLLDFMKFKKEATKAAASAMIKAGLAGEKNELSEKLFEFYLSHGIESNDAFEKYLLKEFGAVDCRVLAAGVNAYLKEKYLHLLPYPHTAETLAQLKKMGIKLAVVTDGVRLKAWMRLCEAGLDGYFDAVVTHEDTGKKKPSKEPFLEACRQLKIEPAQCLMVGDWPERDIEGAKALGMKTCIVKYARAAGGPAGADYEIQNPKEILNIIGENRRCA
ncbi:MAG: hypothetical protein MSIBF_04895 [Candidatus Altiarchaeales archaeon IMC4]|nr:MAG: hypothetical protein MSIBF_04895 [Candidatus Altiarchaeales archaeon IMC4]